MCGFVGVLSSQPIDLGCLHTSLRTISHRGPDGSGLVLARRDGLMDIHYNEQMPPAANDVNTAIAHRRLSILDISDLASQPMQAQGVAICFNGVIYNFAELRDDLKRLGYSFRSTGDTEVALKAYLAWGNDCFARFEGMWAIAILDSSRRKLVLSRDRFGIKPLFWSVTNGDIHFASEIKALRAWTGLAHQPNVRTAAKYLCAGRSDTTSESWFEGIAKFPPGSFVELRLGISVQSFPKTTKFWTLTPEARETRLTNSEQVERFYDLMDTSVGAHLVADVPSGTCLSGGVDSSSIAALAQAKAGTSYSHRGVGYVADTDALSELHFMRLAAQQSGVALSEVRVSADEVIENLPAIMEVHDEPFGTPSAIAQWFVFRRARRDGLSVMLDGQGADEILGGYQGYILSRARSDFLRGDLKSYFGTKRDWERTSGNFPLSVMRILLKAALPNYNSFPELFSRGALYNVLNDPIRSQVCNIQDFYPPRAHVLTEVLVSDVTSNILPALLRYEDTNSMAHSVESRVPFLDHKLVEFCFQLDDDQKVDGMRRKKILIDAMQGRVPKEILSRSDKIGFTAQPSWLREILVRYGSALIENRTDIEKEWFDSHAMAPFFDSSAVRANEVWRIVNAKFWCRKISNVDLF